MHNSTPDSCERLLAGLIGYDTVNGHISGVPHPERKLAEYLEETARGLGFKAERLFLDADGFNLLVTHEVDRGRPWLLFESHLDTVTVEGMEIDPFQAKIENGRIYGRGACDTKGTGASMLWALKRYAAEAGGSNNIGILYSVDEEIGKSGAQKFVSDQLPALGWRPVGVVVGEPTLLKPVVSHNGVARWKIHTRGVAAHSSDPSQGRSAISTMVRVIDQIETDYVPSLEASHPLTGRAQCSVNVIRGGAQINVIPDHCEIEVDRRVVPGEDVNDVLPAVRNRSLLCTVRTRNSRSSTRICSSIRHWTLPGDRRSPRS